MTKINTVVSVLSKYWKLPSIVRQQGCSVLREGYRDQFAISELLGASATFQRAVLLRDSLTVIDCMDG